VIWLPDTNVFSAHLRGRDAGLSARLTAAVRDGRLLLSFFVLCELRYGADKALRSGEKRPAHRVAKLAQALPVALPSEAVPDHYGRIRAALEAGGTPIGGMDLLLAAHALALEACVVTANTREFARVDGLTVDDWRSEQNPR